MYRSLKENTIKKWTIIILVDLGILLLLIYIFGFIRPFSSKISIEGIYINHPVDINEINLIDHNGHPFTKAQLKNRWTMLVFGFTRCPMICPTTLDALTRMSAILKTKLPAELLPQIIFITIDPERDDLAQLKQFINAHNPQFIGARTAEGQEDKPEKQFSIYVANKNGNIKHNTDIILLNPKAQIQAYFLYPHKPLSMANDYQTIVKAVN